MEKIKPAISQFKLRMAADRDNLPPEMFKMRPAYISYYQLHPLFKVIWDKEKMPASWKESSIIKSPKKATLLNAIFTEG